jgi:N-acetylmuramoyl-L-alanine amidase
VAAIKRFLLDPGHSWANKRPLEYDPGATYGTDAEAEIVGAIARNLGYRRHQFRGITFSNLPDLGIGALVDFVNEHADEGDYLISLHMNSAPRPESGSGCEVIYSYKAPLERRVDAELLGKTFAAHLGRPFRRVLRDDETPAGKEKPNGVKGLPIVRDVKIPALLIELGFINSATDRRAVKERGEDALAAALQALALSKGGA